WGVPGGGPGQFYLPHGIAVAADGRVFVCDRENDRIQIFSPDGEYLSEWTDTQRPTHLVFDGQGRAYVSELPWHQGQTSQRHGPVHTARCGRVSVYDGERVKNITAHPAFQNCARMLARLYDALHEDHTRGAGVLTMPTDWGGFTHRYFRAPTTLPEQVAGRDAIAAWARLTYGWLGRSPDYKAAFLATLGANAEFYAPYQENARRWYRFAQERVAFINHAIIHPPVDRNMAPGATGGPPDL